MTYTNHRMSRRSALTGRALAILSALVALPALAAQPPLLESSPAIGQATLSGALSPGAAPGTALSLYVNGAPVPASPVVAPDGSWTVAVPPLAARDIAWATAKAPGDATAARSNVVTVLEPLPAPVVTTPVLATAAAVNGTFACDSTFFRVEQAGQAIDVYPIEGSVPVADLYGFDTVAADSAASDLAQSGRASLALYRDVTTMELSLVLILDAPGDGSGGTAKLTLAGLPKSATLAVADDPQGATSSYDLATGALAWSWDSCCTAGAAISGLGDDLCVTLTATQLDGLTGIDIVHGAGSGVRVGLLATDTPVSICGVPCSAATIDVALDGQASGSSSVTAGAWVVPATLSEGQEVTATATYPEYGTSPADGPHIVQVRTAEPVLAGPVFMTATTIAGALAEADGAAVRLYRNGQQVAETTAASNAFSFAINGLQPGDTLFATAQAADRAVSFPSVTLTVLQQDTTLTPALGGPFIEGATEICGVLGEADGTVVQILVADASAGAGISIGGTFCVELTAPLIAGQQVRATAVSGEKEESPSSTPIKVLARTVAPVIAGPVSEGAALVTGTCSEQDGVTVTLHVDGVAIGSDVLVSQQWAVPVADLVAGESLTATAEAVSKAVSLPSSPVVVEPSLVTAPPQITAPLAEGEKSVSGTVESGTGAVILFINGAYVGTKPVSAGVFSMSVPPLVAGAVVTATAIIDPKVESAPSAPVVVLARTATPALDAPIYDDDAVVTGTLGAPDGTPVFLYVNDVNYTTVAAIAGVFEAPMPAGVVVGDSLFARAKADGEAVSFPSVALDVLLRPSTAAPTLDTPLTEGDVLVTGQVAEPAGTTVTLLVSGAPVGETTTGAGGVFSVEVAPLAGGATVQAVATAQGKKAVASAVVTVLSKSKKPVIAGPIYNTTKLVGGTVAEVDGTVVSLLRNGLPLGTVQASGGAFAVPVTDLVAGDTLTARAEAPGEALSDPSEAVVVEVQSSSQTPAITGTLIEGATTVSGTSAGGAGTLIRIYAKGQLVGTAAVGAGTFTVTTTPLQGGDKVHATSQAQGLVESPPSATVIVLFRSDAPTLAAPLFAQATTVTGTSGEANGTVVRVFVDGAKAGEATVTAGGFSAPVAALKEGATVTATAEAPGEAESFPSAPVVVGAQQKSAAPVVTPPLLQLDTEVIGTTSEPNLTVVRVFVNGAQAAQATASNGGFSVVVQPLALGDEVTATAEAPGKTVSGESPPVVVGHKDTDGDTIDDVDEGTGDADDDGTPNTADKDADGDGIPDAVEAGDDDLATPPVDTDLDDTPDFLDDDSDDDGVPDSEEGATDCDGDGTPNYLDPDSDDDGILDGDEPTGDTDGDGRPDICDDDAIDPDADDDGDTITNGDEGSGDFDGDGTPNYLDPDSDGDGVLDRDEAGDDKLDTEPVDSDGDNKPDFLDLDSDGDTIADKDEMDEAHNEALAGSVPDSDSDSTWNLLDPDSDGDTISDADEAGDTTLDTPPVDTDQDGLPDFLDVDSDGDGIPDGEDNCRAEANDDQADCDDDGTGDACQEPPPGCMDGDGDGVPDAEDNCKDVANPDQADCDGDGEGDACEAVQPPCKVVVVDENAGQLYGGGGCGSTGGSSGGPLALVALLGLVALAVRRRAAIARLTLLALLLVAPGARGQAIDVQRFKPAAGTGNYIGTWGADVGSHMDFSVGFVLDYASDPLVLYRDGEEVDSVVGDMLTGNFLFSLTLWEWVQPALTVPVNFAMLGNFEGADLPGTTMGDLALHVKVRILDRRQTAGFGLAFVPSITFPTGNSEDFSGSGTVTGVFRLVADYAIWRFKFAGNIGYALRSGEDVRNVHYGDELTFDTAVAYQIIDPLTATWELSGATAASAPFEDDSEAPLETRLGLRGAVASNLYVMGGAGVGLAHGAGTPDFRVFTGLSWAPERRDHDGDGIADDQDDCPDEPEDKDGYKDHDGCPDLDNDEDGIFDLSDACPLVPEDRDGFEDEDGCPDIDNDKDGVLDAVDQCKNDPEDNDGFEDEDGCPDADNDKDGIVDADDQCPNDAESPNGFKDDDGCPDGDPKALIVGDRIQLFEKVHFALGRSEVMASSYPLLNDVIEVVLAHPDIEEVLVAGHTDSMGPDAMNMELSALRAQSVADYLVMSGLDVKRVKAKGFGETEPVAPNDTEEGRERNRRVEILITKQKARVQEAPISVEPAPVNVEPAPVNVEPAPVNVEPAPLPQ